MERPELFNPTQQALYETSLDFTVTQLNKLVDLSREHVTALRAVFFSLTVAIQYDETVTNDTTKRIYPESKYVKIRSIFCEINRLVHGQTSTHQFIRSIIDPRLFTSKGSEDMGQVEMHEIFKQEFARKMKIDLQLWMEAQRQLGLYREKDLDELKDIYFGANATSSALSNC